MDLSTKIVLIFVFMIVEVHIAAGAVDWDSVRCSKDPEDDTPASPIRNIGRFPWLGIVQHSFYIGGQTRFAISTGVLIHTYYAIAPVDDIAGLMREQLTNNTKFILWYSSSVKYAMDVNDFILHPEYEEQKIKASIALLQLESHGETSFGENPAAVLPICLPISGAGSFSELFAVRISDDTTQIQKEFYRMDFVNDHDCKNFYVKHELTAEDMSPVSPLCASARDAGALCVWDAGAALITRQSWGFWRIQMVLAELLHARLNSAELVLCHRRESERAERVLGRPRSVPPRVRNPHTIFRAAAHGNQLGFSVRGPGCGAPARFLVLHDYLPWIDHVITSAEEPDDRGLDEEYAIGFRRLSPIKIIMYKAGELMSKEMGNCDRRLRGNVLYKEALEVTMTKDFAQGFFYVIVTQIAEFNCAIVDFQETTYKSNTALWIEHYCHRELTGIAHGQKKPKDFRRQECFMYFKSTAFVKFRFYFSFKAIVEMTLYGKEEIPRSIPNPFFTDETTDVWVPTYYRLKGETFEGYSSWWGR